VPLGFELIDQQITHIDPFFCYIWSPTHMWRLAYRTSEMEPAKVRKLLSTHPDLMEEPGKPDAGKRIALARFMLDTGWLQYARDDLDQLKKDFPAGVPAAVKDVYEALVKDTDTATAALVIKEAELALAAGRYHYASDVLAAFPEKIADAKQTGRVTELMAQWKAALERYDTGRHLLREFIDELTGTAKARPLLAVGGGTAMIAWHTKQLPTPFSGIAAAAEEVYAELHPDSAQRLESFVNLATQYDRERMQGRDPSKRIDELLAAAISGWAKGKNGATEQPASALRIWTARQTVLAFQRSNDLNTRNEMMSAYKNAKPLPIDELAQIISLLPPAEPENLLFRSGKPVQPKDGVPPGVYRRTTPATANNPGGIPYFVKLPPEYHHGRAYPVMIVLTHPGADAEQALGSIAYEADRNGYILLAPEWANEFAKGWQWRGEDHEWVTAVLRDAVRRFCVDNDRVFLFGAADGANMAMDIGMSHPDLFAGVLAMSPIPPPWPQMFGNYWQNAQKLPFYIIVGEQATDSTTNLRQLYQKWMPYGFPGIMVVYKGRGIEWYGAEVPVMFDWMSRKKRVSAKATLQLNQGARFRWETMRETDSHFYWLSVDKINERNLRDNHKNDSFPPANIIGDVNGNNVISINCLGVQRFSIWLDSEMIDWSKPVTVNVNSSLGRDATTGKDWRPKVLQPDIETLFNDYRDRGDRRMLFLRRLELIGPP
jgi:hypothetical protein